MGKNDMTRTDLRMLHKYMCSDRAMEVLRTNQVFFPLASRFNDPFDCAILFEHEIAPEEFVEAAYRMYRQDGHDWESIKKILDADLKADGTLTDRKRAEILAVANEFKESNAQLGVLSLSEDPVSLLMWAHYGQQHCGVCVGFERSPTNTLGDDEITHPVEYSDIYPEARFVEITKGNATLSRKVLYTKARDWSYEKEWRLTCKLGDQLQDVPGKVLQVILGVRTTPEVAAAFKEECSKRHVRLLQSVIDPGKFKLATEEVRSKPI